VPTFTQQIHGFKMTQYECPHCQNAYTAEESLAGQLIACPHCNERIQLPPEEIVSAEVISGEVIADDVISGEVISEPESMTPRFVSIAEDGRISANFETVPEAKKAIEELQLQKKQLNLRANQISQQLNAIQAKHGQVRSGSRFVGGGRIGRIVRSVQSISRDTKRMQFASEMAPLKDQRQRIDSQKNAIDQVILQVEEYILRNS